MTNPEKQRDFAEFVVQRLRNEGFQALWAGGCVRDLLLQHTPKDYDVATDAVPDQVRRIFGKQRTVGVGAQFGVIMVLGGPEAGQVEVATFREDVDYRDGRRPERVVFSTPEEDAKRRDFTINGMFFDPVHREIHDYVGGKQDLQAGIVRAIGNPHLRIEEDKLRMLRAVRFTATFAFQLDEQTHDAVRQHAAQIEVVSAERIREELRRMLVHKHRVQAVELLEETHLLEHVIPELLPLADQPFSAELSLWDYTKAVLHQLQQPSQALAFATLLLNVGGQDFTQAAAQAGEIALRLRCSNKDVERIRWLVGNQHRLDGADQLPWSQLQPLLLEEGITELVDLHEARRRALGQSCQDLQAVRAKLSLSEHELNPPPLLNGGDLIRHGVPRGPVYSQLLQSVRNAQLDGQIRTRDEALQFVDGLLSEPGIEG